MAQRVVCLSQHGPLCHADVLVLQNFDEAPFGSSDDLQSSWIEGHKRCTPLGMFCHSSLQILSISASLDGDQQWRDIFIFRVPPEMFDRFKSGLRLGSL